MMEEKHKHLATFQNLCIIAYADGNWHDREKVLLAEAAESMGLTKEDTHPIISKAGDLDFIVPPTEGERYMELRMVVLMMVHDGKLDKREYQGCLNFALKMGIEKAYLDEVVQFYIEKEQERIKHLGMFQNLYLVAAADGVIGPEERNLLFQVAENLGLSRREVESVAARYPDMDFVIPQDEEERFYSLKNLVFMMIVDGNIKQKEFDLCLRFAEMIGMDRKAVEQILDEYEQNRKIREADPSKITQYNIDIYLDAYNAIKKIPMSEAALAEAMEESVIHGDLERKIGDLDKHNRAFYDWLWLMHVRGSSLSQDLRVVLPLYLDMVKNGSNFKPILDYLIRMEQERGATAIALPEMDLKAVLEDLKKVIAD